MFTEFDSKVMDDIGSFCKGQKFSKRKLSRDGRVDSVIYEKKVACRIRLWSSKSEFAIKNGLSVVYSDARKWYDIAVIKKDDSSFLLPINIKISSLSGNDNSNCKMGIYYALTGMKPDYGNLKNSDSWHSFIKRLKKNIGKKDGKDYFFIVFDKNGKKDVFWNSISGMSKVCPNGSNLPFQIKWLANTHPVKKNESEMREMILSALGRSLKERANPSLEFEMAFGHN